MDSFMMAGTGHVDENDEVQIKITHAFDTTRHPKKIRPLAKSTNPKDKEYEVIYFLHGTDNTIRDTMRAKNRTQAERWFYHYLRAEGIFTPKMWQIQAYEIPANPALDNCRVN